MHALHVFAAGLALSAASANAISGQGKACSQAMKLMPLAGVQTFCSSFLNIKTSTIRTTATSTQSLLATTSITVYTTPIETATSSPSTILTVLETTTPRTRVTSTPTTTSTSTLSLTQIDTTTETAQAVTITSGVSSSMARVKRGLNMGPILKLFAAPVVSEACSVFIANPSPKTTTTLQATRTVYTGTATITLIVTADPTTTIKTLDVATQTTTQTEKASQVTDTETAAEETLVETITSSITIISTSTVTPTITVAPPCPSGQSYDSSIRGCKCPDGTVLDTADQTCQACTESNISACPVPSIGKTTCVNRQCSIGMTTYPAGPAFAACPASPGGYVFESINIQTPFDGDRNMWCTYRAPGDNTPKQAYYRASDGDLDVPTQAGAAPSEGRACYIVCPPALANAVNYFNAAYLNAKFTTNRLSCSYRYSSDNRFAFACDYAVETGLKATGGGNCPIQIQRSSTCLP